MALAKSEEGLNMMNHLVARMSCQCTLESGPLGAWDDLIETAAGRSDSLENELH